MPGGVGAGLDLATFSFQVPTSGSAAWSEPADPRNASKHTTRCSHLESLPVRVPVFYTCLVPEARGCNNVPRARIFRGFDERGFAALGGRISTGKRILRRHRNATSDSEQGRGAALVPVRIEDEGNRVYSLVDDDRRHGEHRRRSGVAELRKQGAERCSNSWDMRAFRQPSSTSTPIRERSGNSWTVSGRAGRDGSLPVVATRGADVRLV
jgi:hypothetical protein